MINQASTPGQLENLATANSQALHELREKRADLVSPKGVHFADVLDRLLLQRKEALARCALDVSAVPSSTVGAAPAPEKELAGANASVGRAPQRCVGSGVGPHRVDAANQKVDKSVLQIGTLRRVRNKAHLAFVGSQPCLICSELPCHAHHLTFAQPRGLSLKVSDEFTVPLCPVHHNLLHQAANERDFWRQHGIDALPFAAQLWAQTAQAAAGEPQS